MSPERAEEGNGSKPDAGMSLRVEVFAVDPFVSAEHEVRSPDC